MARIYAGPNWEHGRPTGQKPVLEKPGCKPPVDAASEEDEWIERLAWLMDNSIPIGGRYRIGIEGIIGLIPGIGDLVGSAISSIIVMRAHKAGVPRATLFRMIGNVGIDAALGAIPFVGDLFDFAYKANAKNLQLYREALKGQREPARDWAFVILLVAALGAAVAIPIVVLILLIRAAV